MKCIIFILLWVFCLLSFVPVKGKPKPASPLRSSCKYSSTGDSNTNTHGHKLKIGIIVLYGRGVAGGWEEDVMRKVLQNRFSFANHHGYDVINCNHLIDPTRPVAWKKSAKADLILQADWNGPNTGIFLAKNTNWTQDFIQLAWNQKQLVRKQKVHQGRVFSHPFEYEQRAFHYLLDTEQWRKSGLPSYDHDRSKDFLTHITFLPQCAMNSYTIVPKNQRNSEYVAGDFVIHFAGHRGPLKMNLLRHYLNDAEIYFKEHGVVKSGHPSSLAIDTSSKSKSKRTRKELREEHFKAKNISTNSSNRISGRRRMKWPAASAANAKDPYQERGRGGRRKEERTGSLGKTSSISSSLIRRSPPTKFTSKISSGEK